MGAGCLRHPVIRKVDVLGPPREGLRVIGPDQVAGTHVRKVTTLDITRFPIYRWLLTPGKETLAVTQREPSAELMTTSRSSTFGKS